MVLGFFDAEKPGGAVFRCLHSSTPKVNPLRGSKAVLYIKTVPEPRERGRGPRGWLPGGDLQLGSGHFPPAVDGRGAPDGHLKIYQLSKHTSPHPVCTGNRARGAALAPSLRRPPNRLCHAHAAPRGNPSIGMGAHRSGRARSPPSAAPPPAAASAAHRHIVPTPQRGALARAKGRCHMSQLPVLSVEPLVLGMQFVDRREQLARLH